MLTTALLAGGLLSPPPAAAQVPPPFGFGPSPAAALFSTPAALRPLDEAARRWVRETLASLSLREKAGQLISVWVDGGYAAESSDAFRELVALVEGQGIGGLTISLGLPHAYAAKLNALQARARVPLLVSSDFEAGPGSRLGAVWALPWMIPMGGGTELPPAMGWGAIGDERLARRLGVLTAREARAVGVHLIFAPVLDINSNPANPIINTRSFGENPALVARLASAFIGGLHEGGALATGKHFPGHGDTRVDSHLELPAIEADRARLDSLELAPFRAAIAAEVDAIMTAHLALPGLLGPGAPPATLSSRLMTGLLREELGFGGLVFTDALDMAAIVEGYGGAEAAVRAIEAGADVALMPRDPAQAIEAIVAAVRSGRLSGARIDSSVSRLLEAKARAGLHRRRRVDPGRVAHIVGARSHFAVAESAAARSLVLARDRDERVPLAPKPRDAPLRAFSLTFARPTDLAAGLAFDARVAGAGVALTRARATPETPTAELDSLGAAATAADLVLLSVYLPPRAGAGTVEPPPSLARFAAAVRDADTPLILVSFGSPYLLSALPEVGSYLLAWGGRAVSQRAAADALLGRAAIEGRLPISLPPFHRAGEGLQRPGPAPASLPARTAAPNEAGAALPGSPAWPGEAAPDEAGMRAAALARVDALLLAAVAGSVTPGAALAVGRRGRLVRLRGFGRLDWAPGSATVDDATLYDIASLTKVVGTTSALLLLVQDGALGLDDPVGAHLAEWQGGWKAAVTLRDLLLHRGGLPPFLPWWQEIEGRDAYRAALAELEPDYEPRSRTVYSDLGFMTLGLVVEAAAGQPLDRFLATRLFEPLGMMDTRYRPPRRELARIAPTEVDRAFRGAHVHGVVHDENAYAMGGVAGHAGLFSSARDLARFAEALLRAARGEASGPFDPALVAAFTRRHGEASSRALGWDTPSEGSSAGRCLSARAFGHTGFTGTSLWIDPKQDLFVVLLTNRVNPSRAERRHIPLRRAVHEAAAAAIERPETTPVAAGAAPGEAAAADAAGGAGAESVPACLPPAGDGRAPNRSGPTAVGLTARRGAPPP